MADALPSSLLRSILSNLSNEGLKEFGILTGLNTELEKLSRTIQGVLYDVEPVELKKWGSLDEYVQTWLIQIKEAAYDADDVLDEFDIKVQRREQQRGLKNHVSSCFSLHHNPIAFRVGMARKLKSVILKLDAICERRPFLGLDAIYERGESLGSQLGSTSSPQGVLFVDDSEFWGRHDEKAELINDLVSSSEALSVHALLGIGGIGKTILAQLVFNAETIETHFDLRMWLCVSFNTDIKTLTRAIIGQIERDTGSYVSNLEELESLERLLREKLGGKKFLLVLDDVWEDFLDKWDRLKNAIKSGATGSVVLITTRIQVVAEKMNTDTIHRLGRLSEDDSWSLFTVHAFSMGKAEEFKKTIGKCIVKKCGGVPFVLIVLGRLMRLKQQENEWLHVMQTEIFDLGHDGKMISAALKLSYFQLPVNLRQCFSYCSIYPKNYKMKKCELIQIWMANGFIYGGGRKDLHETGEEIFHQLVAMSLFENVEVDYSGNVTCEVHDLLHDVAREVLYELHLTQPGGSLCGANPCRHVSYFAEIEEYSTLMKGNSKVPSLRSFLVMRKCDRFANDGFSINYDKNVLKWLSSQKYLRILRLDCLNFEKLPMSLSKHLRYLDVSRSPIKSLPESTSSLHKLQTLNLSFCIYLKWLPKGMRNMKNLVYLDIDGCISLKGMPLGMGQLKGMRKLSKFIVGRNDGCKIGELKELNRLEGELSISGLCNVKSVADFKSANLMEKKMLTSLELEFEKNCVDVEALSVLQPHQNLKKLRIQGYGSLQLPDWMIWKPTAAYTGNLDHNVCSLEMLIINECHELQSLPSTGLWCSYSLCHLEICNCSEFITLSDDGLRHLTALQELVLCDCPKMTSLPESIQHLTSLQTLTIVQCEKLSCLPDGIKSLSTLATLKIRYCPDLERRCEVEGDDWQKIAHIRSIRIDGKKIQG